MAKIYSLDISNFRGIHTSSLFFGYSDFVCLIGKGDSGKSTILEAIQLVLSPIWNVPFSDTDFYNQDVNESIIIRAVIYDLPDVFFTDRKFGLQSVFINEHGNVVNEPPCNMVTKALQVKLIVEKNLEPKRYVEKDLCEDVELRQADREKLNIFLISDFANNHFSWTKGGMLYSLLRREGDSHDNTGVYDILRTAKDSIDDLSFPNLEGVIDKIKVATQKLGIHLDNPSTALDIKDLFGKDGRLSLHDSGLPIRLRGKGTRRIISMSIQAELTQENGIVLIDEIEQGLEPYRIKGLIRDLLYYNDGQLFLTTHSRGVVEELACDNIWLINNINGIVTGTNIVERYQDIVRYCPEALYSSKVIVCEGKTELGICRAIDEYRRSLGLPTITSKDTVYVLGEGANFARRAKALKELGLNICVYCDNDCDCSPTKTELEGIGVKVISCEEGYALETQLLRDLPWEGVKNIVQHLQSLNKHENEIKDKLLEMDSNLSLEGDWLKVDNMNLRVAFGNMLKKYDRLKNITNGIEIGKIIFQYYDQMNGKKFKEIIEDINNRIDD